MAPSLLLVIGTLGTAHAEHKKRPPGPEVATLGTVRAERPAPALSIGALALTGTAHLQHTAPSLPETGAAAVTGVADVTGTAGDIAVVGAAAVRDERFLTAGDVAAVLTSHAAEIERCYLDRVGTSRAGSLDVMLVIARRGDIRSVDIAARGASPVATHDIATCIRAAVETVVFPTRRNETTAVVPYFFQRTNAPNAGPQLSCWNPRGC